MDDTEYMNAVNEEDSKLIIKRVEKRPKHQIVVDYFFKDGTHLRKTETFKMFYGDIETFPQRVQTAPSQKLEIRMIEPKNRVLLCEYHQDEQ